MGEKSVTKISLSTFFLVIAVIVIIVMGFFIYKLDNDKKTETQKATDLQAQVTNLNGTVSDLQGKINSISETINSEVSVQATTSNSIQKEVKTNSTDVNTNNVKYEISIKDEGHAIIKATKDGKTVKQEFEMDGSIAETGTMTLPTIGEVALVADTGGEYYGVNVYQLVNGKIEKLGTIDCGADMVNDVTYEVTTKGEDTAVIIAKKNNENIKKKFKMNAEIAKTEVIDVLKCGKVVLVAETGGEYYVFKVYRASQDNNNGKIKDIVEVGTIQYIF